MPKEWSKNGPRKHKDGMKTDVRLSEELRYITDKVTDTVTFRAPVRA